MQLNVEDPENVSFWIGQFGLFNFMPEDLLFVFLFNDFFFFIVGEHLDGFGDFLESGGMRAFWLFEFDGLKGLFWSTGVMGVVWDIRWS